MAISNGRVVKNAAWMIGVQILRSILALVISMLTARYLGPSNFGLISYAASVVAFVVPIMQLGLPNILVQEFVDKPRQEGELVGTSVTLNLLSSLACILGVASFVGLVNAGETTTMVVCLLYSLLLVTQAGELVQYWFQARLASKYVSLTALAVYAIVSAYKIFLLISDKSIYWFAVSSALDHALLGAALLCIYKRQSGARLGFSPALAKDLLAKGRYYILANLMVTVFAQTDRIMLKLMLNDAAAGYYSAAVSCAGITSFVFVAILDSMRPMILESKKRDRAQFENNVSLLYSLIIYLSLAQSVAITALAPLLVKLLYGGAYASTVGILQVLVWYSTFSYVGAVRNIWMLAEGKQKYLWVINLSGAIANVVLNACLIPLFGGVGAAVASLLTQIFANVILGAVIPPIRQSHRLMLKGATPGFLIKSIGKLRRS